MPQHPDKPSGDTVSDTSASSETPAETSSERLEAAMRLLVCGGRDYTAVGDAHRMLDALHGLRPIGMLIHGAARGADSIAANWAKTRGIATVAYPADWDRFGKRAGPVRNRQMLHEARPDAVLAFPGGRGTADMVKQARAQKVPIIELPLTQGLVGDPTPPSP